MQRFYGGDPRAWTGYEDERGVWRRGMPSRLFWLYAQALPRVEAEERLEFVSALEAAGERHMKDADYRSYKHQLQVHALGGRPTPRSRPKSPEDAAKSLAAMGVEVGSV